MRDVQVLAYSREIIRGNPEPSGDGCHRLSPYQRVQIISAYGCTVGRMSFNRQLEPFQVVLIRLEARPVLYRSRC